MRVMLGITGASGAPYAARVLRGLVEAGADTGVCASAAGRQVIALEIYGDRTMDGRGALERFVEDHGSPDVTVWDEKDYSAPYASGSSRTDAVVICPCSMATVGTIVAGAEANLIHRAAGVQLKERRKLVVVPRETPLSSIHLENLLRLRSLQASGSATLLELLDARTTLDDTRARLAQARFDARLARLEAEER